MPPQAIKDAEGVGECAQVFFISECQNGALELGIADPKEPEWQDETAQRQLLNKGDSFFVPPGNIYRLENHSFPRHAPSSGPSSSPSRTARNKGEEALLLRAPVRDAG